MIFDSHCGSKSPKSFLVKLSVYGTSTLVVTILLGGGARSSMLPLLIPCSRSKESLCCSSY